MKLSFGNMSLTDLIGTITRDFVFAPVTVNNVINITNDNILPVTDEPVDEPVDDPVDAPVDDPVDAPTHSRDDIDRIFNWGEDAYSDKLPESQESVVIFDYYARMYSNGDAVGERDGNIYHYDGGEDGTQEITLVGTVEHLLDLAASNGF